MIGQEGVEKKVETKGRKPGRVSGMKSLPALVPQTGQQARSVIIMLGWVEDYFHPDFSSY